MGRVETPCFPGSWIVMKGPSRSTLVTPRQASLHSWGELNRFALP